jgi:hypothetical protein
MTDYTKSTNFTSKDSLSTGNPLKIIKGAEFDTEFNAISTAIATKADTASPTFTGTPLAPTASVGTNTTQLATTALVFAAMQALYPVGTIYSNISVSTNPATLFGFGTWTAIAGRVVVGLDSGDAAFDTVGETGGSKDAVIVSHTHTDSGHGHQILDSTIASTSNVGRISTSKGFIGSDLTESSYVTNNTNGTAFIKNGTANISTTGVSATNANLPPYVVAYVWKRTA